MCLSHLIYTVRPCLIHTCHAMPMPCPGHALTTPFFSSPRYCTAVERRHVDYLPAFGFFRLSRGVPLRLLSDAYQSSSQRSIPTTVKSGSSILQKRRSVKLLGQQFGYFRLPRGLSRRTRHCRSRAGARHGMCELTARHGSGTTWARHGSGMLCVNRPLTSTLDESQWPVSCPDRFTKRKGLRYTLDRRTCGNNSRPGHLGEKKNYPLTDVSHCTISDEFRHLITDKLIRSAQLVYLLLALQLRASALATINRPATLYVIY